MCSGGVDSNLCPKGYWIDIRTAINVAGHGESGSGIEVDKRTFRNEAKLSESIYIERGKDSKLEGYKRCEFVYFSKPGTRATANLALTLPKWCRLSQKLSEEDNWSSLDGRSSAEFEQYTGVKATPENIRLSFEKGVFTSAQMIRSILDTETNEREEAKKLEASSICTKGCTTKKLRQVTNTPYLKEIGICIDAKGTYRSEKCRNVEVINGCCKFCRSKKTNLRQKQWEQLFKPAPEKAKETDDYNLLSTRDIEVEVIERVDVLTKQGKLDDVPTDPMLLDAAILLRSKDQFITNIGN